MSHHDEPPDRTGSFRDQRERGAGYVASAEEFTARPWCLGWHWCSWLENPHRGFGLKDPWDEPYRELTDLVTETNHRLRGGAACRTNARRRASR